MSIKLFDGDDQSVIKYNSNKCYPYFIEIQLAEPWNETIDYDLDNIYDYQSCDYWNTVELLWDTSGCFVADIIDTSMI